MRASSGSCLSKGDSKKKATRNKDSSHRKQLLLSRLLSGLLRRLLRLLLLLLLHSLHRSHLLHDLLLLNQEGTQNARPSTTTPNNSPVMDALVAQITTISTGHRALRSGNSSHVSRGDAGKLGMTTLGASLTPARGFLQQPHFIGLTIFLLY